MPNTATCQTTQTAKQRQVPNDATAPRRFLRSSRPTGEDCGNYGYAFAFYSCEMGTQICVSSFSFGVFVGLLR